MNITHWKNEVADMPTQREDGSWFDLETGLDFRPAQAKKAIKAQADTRTLKDLMNEAEGRLNGTKYAVRKYSGNTMYANVVARAADVIAAGDALFNGKRTIKASIINWMEANSNISREFNSVTTGEHK